MSYLLLLLILPAIAAVRPPAIISKLAHLYQVEFDETAGAYKLLSRCSSGYIFKARDLRFNRDVALKIPTRDTWDEIIREGEVLHLLNHPRIPKVIHFLQDHELTAGVPVLVLSYIDGHYGSRMIAQGAVTWDKLSDYVAQLLNLLHYLHSKGVAHLDVQPGNIIIDSQHQVYLTNFGKAEMNMGGDGVTGVQGGVPGSHLKRSSFTDPALLYSKAQVGMAVDYYGVRWLLERSLEAIINQWAELKPVLRS